MKRDFELFRKILFKIEEDYEPGTGAIGEMKIEGYDSQKIAEHCRLLNNKELIENYNPTYADNKVYYFSVGPLTNLGHDFLDEIRDDSLWKQIIKKINEHDTLSAIENIATISTITSEIISKLML